MQQVSVKRDPAPSRWAYRMHRLWLTPLFRAVLRKGVPSFCIITLAGAWLADQERRDDLSLWVQDLRRSVEERPEFMVNLMAIDGASAEVDEDIREILPVDFPASSFDLDLEHMRQVIVGLDAVKAATLRIRPGGILRVTLTERSPAVVWRGPDGLELLDAEGHRVAPLDGRAERPDLPLVAGAGANDAVGEALRLLVAARPIAPRVRGLMRMGQRRWDVVLDRGQRIMLPEDKPVQALERVIALAQAEDMLARDLIAVDMRNSARPTVRLAPNAVEEYRRFQLIEAGATEG